LSENCPKAG